FQTFEEDITLLASFIGFQSHTQDVEARDQQLQIVLKEAVNQLDAVTISAGSFKASEGSKQEVLKPLDVVTTAGTTADIPGVLNTLPGTQTVGETGRLFVRGGDGRETKTFIDGMLVHNEYRPSVPNTPGRSRFSPFMFKDTNFSTGGYSAEYGQALSSVLALSSKDVADADRTDVSLMTVGTDVSTTRSWKNSSVAGKLQYTNLSPYFAFIPQNLKWKEAPEEWNTNLAYRQQVNKTGLLKVYSNLSTSKLATFETDIAEPSVQLPVEVQSDYGLFNASYRDIIKEKWGVRTGFSLTRSEDHLSQGQNKIDNSLLGIHTKVAADCQHSDQLAFLVGNEVVLTRQRQRAVAESALVSSYQEVLAAQFVEAEWYASSKLAFKAGIRGEHNNLNRSYQVDPRLSTAIKTGSKSQVSVAFGQFHQAATPEILLRDRQAVQEKATHFITNYQWTKDNQTFRIEAYHKTYRNLSRYTRLSHSASYQYDGHGYANGLDLFWRDAKTFKGMDYWISYSFLDTERFHRHFPGSFTPGFASAHNLSIVTKKFFSALKSQIGATYSYSSPRAYHNPNKETFLSEKTPSYHDLSVNISYLYNNQVIIHAMVNNVLGISNIFGYEYADTPDANGVYVGRAITPTAPRFIFLGVFITLSKNKGLNQLPNL
ncbi:MAG: TonB-dependent receptor, partial [Bacteroidota bacterium]